MSTQARRKIVERLREEGYQAFIDGKSMGSCPYTYMDAAQWRGGWDAARDDAKRYRAEQCILVPRDPTEEMQQAFQSVMASGGGFKDAYTAMLDMVSI